MSPLDNPQESAGSSVGDHGIVPYAERTPCGCNWAAVYTDPQAERWANENLRQRGFETFLPLVHVTRRVNIVPYQPRNPRWRYVEIPLFPRYLFVAHEPDSGWRPIRDAPGVATLVRCGSRIQYTSHDAIAAVRDAVDAAEARAATPTAWAPGTPCSLVLGALAGQPAIVLSVTGRNATVAVLMLGCLRHAHVPLTALAPRE